LNKNARGRTKEGVARQQDTWQKTKASQQGRWQKTKAKTGGVK